MLAMAAVACGGPSIAALKGESVQALVVGFGLIMTVGANDRLQVFLVGQRLNVGVTRGARLRAMNGFLIDRFVDVQCHGRPIGARLAQYRVAVAFQAIAVLLEARG